VRDRALNSSKSVILQARSLFNSKSELPAKYAERGLPIPSCVQEFMTAKLRGKDKQQHEYLPPPDAIIQRTFKEIEKLKDAVPQTYIAFWLACGCGLRRKEIFRARWEYFILRDGQPWFSGGIGKNGQTIEVPVQKRAWESLKPLRQEEGPCLGEDATMEYARHINGWLTAQGWKTEKKLHELRAYVGSLIYIKDPVAAMKFMRHSSIKITEKFYARYGKVKTPNVL
jgi:integrase